MHGLLFKEIYKAVIRNLIFEIIFQDKHKFLQTSIAQLKAPEATKAKKEPCTSHESQQLPCTSHERSINNSTKNNRTEQKIEKK